MKLSYVPRRRRAREYEARPESVKCADVELDDDLSADSETLYIQICLLNIGGLSDYMPW